MRRSSSIYALAAFLCLPSAASAQTMIGLEGGMACSRGDTFGLAVNAVTGLVKQAGDDGCGRTGAIELSRTGVPMFGLLDHWAIRGRLLNVRDKETLEGTADSINFRERRTTLDAEVGTKLSGFNLFGGVTRVTAGLRYAEWSMSYQSPNSSDDATVRGFGPRLGMRSAIPLFGNVVFEGRTGVSALFARHEVSFTRATLAGTQHSKDSNTVFGVDSASALTYRLDSTEDGRSISVGIYSEYAFGQFVTGNTKNDRHHWGPFARVRMPLP